MTNTRRMHHSDIDYTHPGSNKTDGARPEPIAAVQMQPFEPETRPSSKRSLNRVNRPQQAKRTLTTGHASETLGYRLVRSRLASNRTQAEVAAKITISPKSGRKKGCGRRLSRNAYAMYELDKAEPTLSTIFALAKALCVRPAWLAFGEGKARKYTKVFVSPIDLEQEEDSFANGNRHVDADSTDE